MKAGARDVSQYSQQVGRAGRDGQASICTCFFAAGDADGILDCIDKAVVSSRNCRLFQAVFDRRTVPSSGMCFLHKSDFDSCDILPKHVQGVLAALTGMGVAREGPETPSRLVVQPGPLSSAAGELNLPQTAASLWREQILPQWRKTPSGQRSFARNNVRDVCATSPFLEMGQAGPRRVCDAVLDLATVGAVDIDSVEGTGTLFCVKVLKTFTVEVADRLHNLLAAAADEQRASLSDALGFLPMEGCVHKRLDARFGSSSGDYGVIAGCGCSFCLPGDALLSAALTKL